MAGAEDASGAWQRGGRRGHFGVSGGLPLSSVVTRTSGGSVRSAGGAPGRAFPREQLIRPARAESRSGRWRVGWAEGGGGGDGRVARADSGVLACRERPSGKRGCSQVAHPSRWTVLQVVKSQQYNHVCRPGKMPTMCSPAMKANRRVMHTEASSRSYQYNPRVHARVCVHVGGCVRVCVCTWACVHVCVCTCMGLVSVGIMQGFGTQGLTTGNCSCAHRSTRAP